MLSCFAKVLRISSAHLSDIEKGNRLPSKNLIRKAKNKNIQSDFWKEIKKNILKGERNGF